MEHDTHTILDLQIVDKREVALKSPNMEKEGLIKCLASMAESGILIGELVTDAHRQIACFMRKLFFIFILHYNKVGLLTIPCCRCILLYVIYYKEL